MQCDVVLRDAAGRQGFEELRCEMQPCRRGGHGSLLPREDGLVVSKVCVVDGALRGDVGRERQTPDAGDRRIELGPGDVEAEFHFAALTLPDDLG